MLAYPQVQEELAITEDQMSRIRQTFERVNKEAMELESVQRGVRDVMTPEQRARYDQIRYQILFTRGSLPRELVDRLELGPEESKQLDEALRQNEEATRELLRRLATENRRPPGSREQLKREYFEKNRGRLLAVLTPDRRPP